MLVFGRQVWPAGVRISSSCWPLHAKSELYISCLRRVLFSFSSALGIRSSFRFKSFCLEQSSCWNVITVQPFSTVRSRRRRTSRYPICSQDGCLATYGWEGGSRNFCPTHKMATMINIAGRLCQHPLRKMPEGRPVWFSWATPHSPWRTHTIRRDGRCGKSTVQRRTYYGKHKETGYEKC